MRILALIPARGGSKRLPGKNLKNLGGAPLICWSISIGKAVSEICDVLVSTDNLGIAGIAFEHGALVPWLRPKHLATDDASTVDVAIHALDWYESIHGAVDGLLVLQPTSPFRTVELIERSIENFKKSHHSCVSLSKLDTPSTLIYKIENFQLIPYKPIAIEDDSILYRINGALYLISPLELRLEKKFINKNTSPIISYLDREGLDIDTQLDWDRAQEIVGRDQFNPSKLLRKI
jgi:CMP-N,N'-diacetyllegionaminic acid synthase